MSNASAILGKGPAEQERSTWHTDVQHVTYTKVPAQHFLSPSGPYVFVSQQRPYVKPVPGSQQAGLPSSATVPIAMGREINFLQATLLYMYMDHPC
jgi:hypothetical protein